MFAEMLQEAVGRVQGAEAAVLMGFDGILLDLHSENVEADVESMGMEFSVLLAEVRKAAELMSAGTASEMTLRTDKMLAVLRVVNEEYFVAMTLLPEGNIGKARFVLRTMVTTMNEALS
jgi:predicted regulator of Ras-like GTPase activity (Roadblock/LC7/MglB family)